MITVSFVIPTFNRKAILVECLEALERERTAGVPFEVIVIDDGSTDSTLDEIRDVQSRLSVSLQVVHQQNRGPAAARNLGIKAASGELIVFLGDDIIVEPGYLTNLIQAYQAHPGEIRGVLGHTRYHSDSIPTPFGRWLDQKSGFQFAYQDAQTITPLDFSLFYTSNVLVPRDILLEVEGFNEGLRYAAFEDTELGFRLAQRGLKLYYCPSARAVHVHPVSLGSVAARMAMIARAALELRSLNPVLFYQLYPRAQSRFAHPSLMLRVVRWFFAEVMLVPLKFIDGTLRWAVPGSLYRRTLYCAQTRKIAQLWKYQEKTVK